MTPSIDTLAVLSGDSGNIGTGGLVMDDSGNLYLAAFNGGPAGLGTIFELKKGSGPVTTLASFNGPATGIEPVGGLVMDGSGNLYGTTSPDSPYPATIYEIKAGSNTITRLATFPGDAMGGLVVDNSGNLYGTSLSNAESDGTVFELTQGSSTVTTLGLFDGYNGAYPSSSMVVDGSGNLYGTTVSGGDSNDGTVFEVVQGSDTITALASFDGINGTHPSGVVLDGNGNLYGTTQSGGANNNDGTVFELAQGSGTITTLASFNVANGATPRAGVVLDGSGNLYGTTQNGGASSLGTVFEVAHGSGTITTLASFNGANSGYPEAGLILDSSGNLYGVTPSITGNPPFGTIFEFPALTAQQLVPTHQPPSVVDTNTPFTYVVTADDASGNPLTSFNGPVTVTLTNNTTGATLGGTTTVNAVNGVATFSDLTINLAATGYTLTASADGLGEAVSNSFNAYLPSFILLNNGFLYEQNIQNRTSTVLGTSFTSLSSVGTSPSGTAMVDVTASNGITYEYQDAFHWTALAQGASKAEAGNGTSVVLIGTNLFEYNDASASWSCLADQAASFSVGTDVRKHAHRRRPDQWQCVRVQRSDAAGGFWPTMRLSSASARAATWT